MTQQYTPSVDLTIFPRVNFLRTFGPRFEQRADNGRIFGADPHVYDLAIADGQGANWVTASSNFTQGSDVIAKTATFTGGEQPVTYRARFQTKALVTDADWISEPWVEGLPNEKVPLTIQLSSTTGVIRFQSQATDASDPAEVINSYTGTRTVPYPTLTAASPAIQGQPTVGSTLLCTQPTPSGGVAPYSYTYMWTNAATNAFTFENKYLQEELTLDETDVGITYYCQVMITSADQQSLTVVTPNIGPIV